MKKTGVFATAEEIEQIRAAARRASKTPMIAFSSRHALEEGGLSGQAWKSAKELCHELALKHGLSEIPGYYGVTQDGEFVLV